MRVYKDIRLKNSTTWWYFTSFVVTRQSRNLFFFSKNLTQPDTADGRTDSFTFFWFLRTRGTRRNSRFLCKFIFFLRFVTNAFFRLNGNWAVCLPRRIIHGKLVFVTTNDRRQTTNVALASDSIVQVKVIFNSRFHSFSWPRQTEEAKNSNSTTRFGVSVRTCVSMTCSDVNEPMFTKYRHGRGTVLTNLYVRAIIIAFLVPYLVDRHDVRDWSTAAHIGVLGNGTFSVGDDGRRCGHWLDIYRDVHHGLLEIIPWGEGVWEVREKSLRADQEWDELVYHEYWLQLGNHERIEGRSHDGGDGSIGGVDGHSSIWGGADVLVLTIGGWSSFWRSFSNLSRGWVLSWWGGTHLLILVAVSTMNIVRGEVLTCAMKSRKERMQCLRLVDGHLVT